MTDLTTAASVLAELVALDDMRIRLRNLHEMGHGTDWDQYHRDLSVAMTAARAILAAPSGQVIESHNERWTGADEDGDPIREVGPMTCQPVSEPRQEPVEDVAVALPKPAVYMHKDGTETWHESPNYANGPVPYWNSRQMLAFARRSQARDPLALTDSQIYTVWHRTQFSGEDMTIGDVLEFARAVLAAAGETK